MAGRDYSLSGGAGGAVRATDKRRRQHQSDSPAPAREVAAPVPVRPAAAVVPLERNQALRVAIGVLKQDSDERKRRGDHRHVLDETVVALRLILDEEKHR